MDFRKDLFIASMGQLCIISLLSGLLVVLRLVVATTGNLYVNRLVCIICELEWM